jgi:bacterial/archaeal transporter family protein
MSTAALIILATVAYAIFAIFTSRAGGRVDARLSAGILNGVGALLPLALWMVVRARQDALIPSRPSGIFFSVMAGVAVGAFSIVLLTIYARGGELSFVLPVVYGGAIALTAVVGWAVLGDTFTWRHLVGVAGIVIGIGLLALPAR